MAATCCIVHLCSVLNKNPNLTKHPNTPTTMKKITFILFALIAGTGFGQNSTASDNALVAAEIVSPITIEKAVDLNFGRVANNETGTVVIAPDGTITESTLGQITGGDTPTAASFNVNAADQFKYSVSLPETVTLVNAVDNNITLTVENFLSNAGNEPVGNGQDQTIGVGATLNIIANQKTGLYSGNFDVTVTYE